MPKERMKSLRVMAFALRIEVIKCIREVTDCSFDDAVAVLHGIEGDGVLVETKLAVGLRLAFQGSFAESQTSKLLFKRDRIRRLGWSGLTCRHCQQTANLPAHLRGWRCPCGGFTPMIYRHLIPVPDFGHSAEVINEARGEYRCPPSN